MKCNNCGFEFDEGIFCPECGTKYDEEKAKIIEAEELEIETQKAEESKAQENLLEQQVETHEKQLAEVVETEGVQKEEIERTFNEELYPAVEEINVVEDVYATSPNEEARIKTADKNALISMICGLASWPLALTIILWFPAAIIAIVFGVMALKGGTRKRGFAITGIVAVGAYIGLTTLIIIFGLLL